MSETTADPSATADGAEATGAQSAEAQEITLDIRSLLEAGVHFGHQTRRWNPRMRSFIFGERDGIHIVDLDQSLPRFEEALEFIKEIAASGGKLLFVGTKKQASGIVELEAARSRQFYVNNRWLGGMLTNWKTVKKSLERYKELGELLGDEEKRGELSKKEQARLTRQFQKYAKSLAGMREMSRLPDVLFVIDVGREAIAVSEAKRLGIPIVAVVDTNCNPDDVDFVIPGNDDSLRAIALYCGAVSNACIEGAAMRNARLQSEASSAGAAEGGQAGAATGRRVVEIKQPPRRSRGQSSGGPGGGRTHSSGGRREEEAPAAAPAAAAPVGDASPAADTPPAAEGGAPEPGPGSES